MLGSVDGKRVVELGAGIGRFTGSLAKTAKDIVAIDFMECAPSCILHVMLMVQQHS